MPDPFTTAVVLSPLALWAVVEWKARTDPDWPANCTPFVGAAQRWKQGRENPEPEFVPEPEELPRIPPGMSDDEFEAWLNAPEPGETAEVVAREMSEDGKLLFTPRGARPPVDADEWEKYSRR